MRYSEQRQKILEILKASAEHPTANMVYDAVRQDIPNISLGTVYRNLAQLCEHRLIRKINRQGFVQYDGNVMDHGHMFCRDCGVVLDFPLNLENCLADAAEKFHFQADSAEVRMRGLCQNCKNKNKES